MHSKEDVEKMKAFFKERPMSETLVNTLSTDRREELENLKKEWFRYMIMTLESLKNDIEKLKDRISLLEQKDD
jgi:hypothetical protein